MTQLVIPVNDYSKCRHEVHLFCYSEASNRKQAVGLAGLANVQGMRRGGGRLTGSGEGTKLFYILPVECSLNCIYQGCVTGTVD